MSNDAERLLIDREYLTSVQYRTDRNLAARQAIYQFQHPVIDLRAEVCNRAGLAGAEVVADIGCGNGLYLAELARRGHRGRLVGVDLSAGMLAVTRARVPAAGLAVGDAAALPLADGAADVTLALHMLHHVPDRAAAVRELRRVTRDGGTVLVVLNGADHQAELRELADAAAADAGLPPDATRAAIGAAGVDLDHGEQLLASAFDLVERHDFAAELLLPDAGPVLDYVRSTRLTQSLDDPGPLLAAVASRLAARGDGPIRIRTHCGCLVAR
jgi:ubiquinone/menaquinone biosynthesis C-methylase UbiE